MKRRLEQQEFANSLLVADSGYTNTQYVITPFIEANTEVRQLYNESSKLLTEIIFTKLNILLI